MSFANSLTAQQQAVNLLLTNGQLEEAQVAQRKVVNFCLEKGELLEAVAALHQLIGLNPTNATAYKLLQTTLEIAKENYKPLTNN